MAKERFDAILRDATEGGALPCAAAAFVSRTGETYKGAFGYRSAASEEPLRIDSIFRIASMTKAAASVAALQWVEAGAVTLDEPISRCLPELADRKVLRGFDGAGKPVLEDNPVPVTLRQLLTHSAGFGYEVWNRNLLRCVEDGHLESVFEVFETGSDRFLEAPLVNVPGTVWEYGISTDFVGLLVERLSGQPLGDYMATRIFGPLGMADTAFNLPPEKHGRVVTVHDRAPGGTLSEQPEAPLPERAFHSAGGGLYSTAEDYLRFLEALLHGGRLGSAVLLGEELVAEALRDHIAPLTVQPLKTVMPEVSNDCDLGASGGFGLGFAVNPRPLATGRRAGSGAWAGLFNSYFWLDPASGVAGLFLSQLLPFCDTEALAAFERFEAAVYDTLS